MIVRIMGEGQFELADAEMDDLNRLDDELMNAVQSTDESAFQGALGALLAKVRGGGSACEDEFLGESDFVLPSVDATLEEVSALLADDGLVPG
ncbi:MAG: hypothetical protein JWL76_501 [Thermoleophilia bacterium]|nr:hypothetical protein [Thermoleophilia bacterium]